MYGKKYWYGKEVEGRLLDVETVYCRSEIPKNVWKYPHIYFTIEFVTKMVTDIDWGNEQLAILKKEQGYRTLTIEANAEIFDKIPVDIKQQAHIIFRIKEPLIDQLKETDTISIDQRWYNVYQIMKKQMIHSDPDAYKFDRENE